MIKEIIKKMALPQNQILFVHCRLKGIDVETSYIEQAELIIKYLEDFYLPKTILIPTYTYSFTKNKVFNRADTPSEVGRFGEEIRNIFSTQHRSLNPVFSVIDTNKLFIDKLPKDMYSSFDEGSLFNTLSNIGYLMLNINLEELRPAHLHFIEWKMRVPYRFDKFFDGIIIDNGEMKISYKYFVRDLEVNPSWNRIKIQDFLEEKKVIHNESYSNINLLWMHSFEMDYVLENAIKDNPHFLIK